MSEEYRHTLKPVGVGCDLDRIAVECRAGKQIAEQVDRLLAGGRLFQELQCLLDFPVFVLGRDSSILWFNSIGADYVRLVWDAEVQVGDSMVTYSDPELLGEFKRHLEAAFEGENVQVTREVHYPNGMQIFFTVRYVPVVVDDEVDAVIFAASDISREVLALRDKKAFQTALNRLSVGVTVAGVSDDFPLTYVNDGFVEMVGYSREELVGRNCRFLQEDLDQGEELERLRELLRTRTPGSVVLKNRRKNGEVFLNRLEVSPVFGEDGELLEYIGLQTDVTEEIAMREAVERAQRMESLGELAAGMAHDFNNVLQVIMQSSQLGLEETSETNLARSDLKTIEQAARHGHKIVSDLMTFARAKPSARERLDLVELVERLAPMLRALLHGRGRVSVDLPGESIWIAADRNEVEQMFLNLVANARDAIAADGRVEVVVEEQRDGVGIVVRDDGCGMSKETVERVFEPFFTTKGEAGTGLGLATAFGTVTGLGGRIDVSSAVGEGTEFEIWLPSVD